MRKSPLLPLSIWVKSARKLPLSTVLSPSKSPAKFQLEMLNEVVLGYQEKVVTVTCQLAKCDLNHDTQSFQAAVIKQLGEVQLLQEESHNAKAMHCKIKYGQYNKG